MSFCKANGADYMGTIFMNFLNNIKMDKRKQAFDNSAIKTEIITRITTSPKKVCVGFISLFSHWSSLVIDKENSVGYHYNSIGYIPSSQFDKNLVPYSYDRTLDNTCYMDYKNTSDEQITMINFLNYLIKTLKLKKLYLNVETAQLVDGECGMFSLIFNILLLENRLSSDVCQLVYTFFKFFGDKRMREIRELMSTSVDTYVSNIEATKNDQYKSKLHKRLTSLITNLGNLDTD